MKELKTTQVSIRLTDSERRTIKKCAGDARMAEAEYIRNKVLDRKEKTDYQEILQYLEKLNRNYEKVAGQVTEVIL